MKSLPWKSILGIFLFSVSSDAQTVQRQNHVVAKPATFTALRVRTSNEPDDLDWTKFYGTFKGIVVKNIMEGLVEINEELQPVSQLAESWTVTSDFKKYTFKIRKNVYWSTGEPLTAKDFVEAWFRMIDPKRKARDSAVLFPIENAKKYFNGVISDRNLVGIKQLDPHTLQVSLEEPMSFFEQVVSHPCYYPINEKRYAQIGENIFNLENLSTVGPYVVKSWKKNESMSLAVNGKYFSQKPNVNEVNLILEKDTDQAIKDFLEKKYDVILDVSQLDILKANVSNVEMKVFKTSLLSTVYLGFYMKSKKVSDLLVRKAIAHAIDKDSLVKELGRDYVKAESLIPFGMVGYSSKASLSFNKKTAQSLLATSPMKDRIMKEGLSFVTGNSTSFEDAELIVAMIKKNLGVPVTLHSRSLSDSVKESLEGKHDLMWSMWSAEYPHSSIFLETFQSFASSNKFGFSSEEYDDLLKQGKAAHGKGAQDYFDIAQNSLVADNVVIVPLFHRVLTALLGARVGKFTVRRTNNLYFKDIVFKNRQ